MQAIILAAGKGTRLQPLTNEIPKAMLKVNGRPMLEIILAQLKSIGVTEVVIVVKYLRDKITNYFGQGEKIGMKLTYVEQKEMIGDADAALTAAPHITDNKFFIIACDSLFPTKHLHKLLANKADGVMTACVVQDARRFGVLITEGKKVVKIIEKSPQPPTNLANTSIHIMPREIFEACRNIEKGVGGEYRLVDAIQKLINEGTNIEYEALTDWLDIGTVEQYNEAQELAKKIGL